VREAGARVAEEARAATAVVAAKHAVVVALIARTRRLGRC
jgi:hypothetical protein